MHYFRPLIFLLTTTTALLTAACGAPNEDASQVTQDMAEQGDTISPPADETKGMDNTIGYGTVQHSTDYEKMVPLPAEAIEAEQRYPVYLPDRSGLDLSPERYHYRFLVPEAEEEVAGLDMREEQPPLFDEVCQRAANPLNCSNERLRNFLREQAAADSQSKLVYAYITINEQGQMERVDQLKVGTGEVCANCTKIAREVLHKMPKWVPARLDGIPVKSQVVLPIYTRG